MIENLERLISLADTYGVTLCHENEAAIYGDTPERCLDLLSHFEGRLGCVFDMGNFALEGIDTLAAYRLLSPYISYFHIKDSLAAGAIVPPGAGEANIERILSLHETVGDSRIFVTLEPHLETFSGLNALVGRSFVNPYKYDTPKSAFTDALSRLRGILA